MPINNISLGEFEKQVLLELDKQLTLAQSQWMRSQDPNFTLVHGTIESYFSIKADIIDVIIYIHMLYGLPTNECVLIDGEGVAVLGYN